jgi:hypothetical protein
VLFGSKFVVLEVINVVFGSSVSLGGFFSVTALIVVLMAARNAVRRLLQTTSPPTPPRPEDTRPGRRHDRDAPRSSEE